MATPGMSECDTSGLDENTEHLVDRRTEATPKLCPLDPPGPDLQDSTSRLL